MVFNATFNMNINVISITYSFSYVELCLTFIISPETNKKIVIKTNITIIIRLPHVYNIKNRIGCVMVSMLASSTDGTFVVSSTGPVKPKTIKLINKNVFVASPLSTQH